MRTLLTALLVSVMLIPVANAAPNAPPAELVTELKGGSRSEVSVGDRLEIAVRLPEGVAPEGVRVAAAPDSRPLRELGWEVRLLQGAAAEGAAPGELRIRVYPLQPGELMLPPLWIRDGTERIVGRTQPLPVRVVSAVPQPTPDPAATPGAMPPEPKPADSLPPVSLERPVFVKGLYGLAILLAVLAMGALGVALLRRLRCSKKAASPEDPGAFQIESRTAERDALEALKRLDAKGWPAKGDHRRHFYAASRVLKRYIGAVYGFDAEESTSQELLARLRDAQGVSSERLAALSELLASMDRVKYARGMPSGQESQALTREIRAWIQGGARAV